MSSQTSSSSSVVSIEKFNGKNNFSLWRIKIRALLKQQGIWAPLAGPKPTDMTDAKYNSQDENAHSTILLSLSDGVFYRPGCRRGETLPGSCLRCVDASFVEILYSFVVGKDTITLEDVRSSLHSRELRQQASGSGGHESQSMGLLTTSRDRSRYRFEKGRDHGGASSSSRGPNPRDICNYCKETGHWKIDCPKLKEKLKALAAATTKDNSCYSGLECDVL
ncbi:retrovirus-related pol polyprotein from transposon TNT 1-94 [Tanacetum coccineum]